MILPIIASIILGAAIVVFTVFLIRNLVAPKQIDGIVKLIKQDKASQAVKAAKKIIVREPRSTDAHYLLGMAYEKEGKEELALMEYQTVNQLGLFTNITQEGPFRERIARLYTKFNQPEEALKEYLLLAKREPNNPKILFEIGSLFESRNRSDKAASYYKKAIDLDQNNAEAHFRLGSLFYRAKRSAEAKEFLERAIKLKPDNLKANYYLGKILKDNRDWQPALSYLEKASKDPEFKSKALVERGGAYMQMSQFERAIPELQRAVKSAPSAGSQEALYARYFLSIAFEKTRQIEPAIEQWEAIYSQKPGFRDVAEKLSQYQELRTDDRVKDYMTAAPEEFLQLCTGVVDAMGLTVRDTASIGEGCRIVAVESQSKWRNARKLPKLIQFLRLTDPVDEPTIRDTHEEMKKQNITRGVVVSSSDFTRRARTFAESRPVDLYGREQLQTLLKRSGA